MLKKQQRLERRDFSSYFAQGARHHSPYLTLIHTPGVPFRAAAVVSKKVAKKAHERNTIRRRVYAALQQSVLGNETLVGVVIVVVKPTFASLSRLKQQAEVRAMVGRLTKGR